MTIWTINAFLSGLIVGLLVGLAVVRRLNKQWSETVAKWEAFGDTALEHVKRSTRKLKEYEARLHDGGRV